VVTLVLNKEESPTQVRAGRPGSVKGVGGAGFDEAQSNEDVI
jgi:hypothetical protein